VAPVPLFAAVKFSIFGLTVRDVDGAAAPNCVTVNRRDGPFSVHTYILPDLEVVLVFATATTLKVPLPNWVTGRGLSIPSQLLLLCKNHHVLDATFVVVIPPAAPTLSQDIGLTVSVGAPAWVTEIVRVVPGTSIVIVPDLDWPKFCIVLTLNDPLPVRFAGLKLSNVSQLTLLVTLHCLLDVTLIVLLFGIQDVAHVVDGDTVSVAGCGSWLTVKGCNGPPPAVTVTVPDLESLVVFSTATTSNLPLPVWFTGDGLLVPSQVWFRVKVQLEFDVTFTVVLPPEPVGFQEPGLMLIVGSCGWVTEIVRVIPAVSTLTVPVLCCPVLTVAFIVNDPLPVRFVGEILLTVNHVAWLVIVHCRLDVTPIVWLAAAKVGIAHAVGDTVSLASGAA